MNKCLAINLIKTAAYRETHVNRDKTKTVTIRVGKITVAVFNETTIGGIKFWFVHRNDTKARLADNLQQAYAMALDDFIVALEYQTDNLKVFCTEILVNGQKQYSLYNKKTGMELEYCEGERSYVYKEALKYHWSKGLDSLTVKKIQLAIFIFENA